MAEAGFEENGVYVTRRKNTAAQYITTRPIMDLCEQSVRKPRSWVSWRWWDQEVIYIERANKRVAAESGGEEAQCKEGAEQEDMPG